MRQRFSNLGKPRTTRRRYEHGLLRYASLAIVVSAGTAFIWFMTHQNHPDVDALTEDLPTNFVQESNRRATVSPESQAPRPTSVSRSPKQKLPAIFASKRVTISLDDSDFVDGSSLDHDRHSSLVSASQMPEVLRVPSIGMFPPSEERIELPTIDLPPDLPTIEIDKPSLNSGQVNQFDMVNDVEELDIEPLQAGPDPESVTGFGKSSRRRIPLTPPTPQRVGEKRSGISNARRKPR